MGVNRSGYLILLIMVGAIGTLTFAYRDDGGLTPWVTALELQKLYCIIAVAGQPDIVCDNSNDTLTFVAGPGILLTTNATLDALNITSIGGVNNTGANVGGGAGVFRDNTAEVLNFRSIIGVNGITATQNANDITINYTTTWGNVTNLNDLGDVEIVGPTTDQFLRYNGTYWNNTSVTIGNASALNDLSDVAFDGTPLTNEVLTYNGTHWTNETAGAGASDRIFTSDTEVDTEDTGTGFVEVGIDGIMEYNFTGTYLNMSTNKLNFRNNTATNTATPTGNIQIYAVNSTNSSSLIATQLYAVDDLGFNHTLLGQPKPFFKKSGQVIPASAAGTEGLFGGATLDGTESAAVDVNNGGYISTTTGTTVGGDAGVRTNGGAVWDTRHDIYLYAKVRLVGNGYETFIGFNTDLGTSALAGTNTFCNSDSCFGFGIRGNTDTTWQFVRNDGDATADFTSTGIANQTARPEEFQMWTESWNGGRWCARMNDGVTNCWTSEVPVNTSIGVITSIATTDIISDTFHYHSLYSETRR